MKRRRLARPDFVVELSPYPMTLELFTHAATYCRAVRAHKSSEKIEPKDIRSGGACSCFKDHVLVGVFNGDAATLVHELTHALEHVTEHLELPRGFDNNEPAAYLMAHMYRACVDLI
jgi:hypothetical protein